MSSNTIPRGSLDPAAPSWAPSHPRRVLIGTDEHKVRVTSALLPDSPFASTAVPNNQVFIPRLNGSRQLHIEQMEPAWLTGVHGVSKPEKVHLSEAHWHKRHTALRTLNFVKGGSYPSDVSGSASPAINVGSETREPDLGDPKYVPQAYPPSAHRAAANRLSSESIRSTQPQPMARGNILDITDTHQAHISHQADTTHKNYGGDANSGCVCSTGSYCPHQGSAGNYQDEFLVENNKFNEFPKKETHYHGFFDPNKFNNVPKDEADHESPPNQNNPHGSVVDLHKYAFPARGLDYEKPISKSDKAASDGAQKNKKKIHRGGRGDGDDYISPPHESGYPAVSGHMHAQGIFDEEFEDEIETTYEEAIADTYAILTRNEAKCTCPPGFGGSIRNPSAMGTAIMKWGSRTKIFGKGGPFRMQRKQKRKEDIGLEETDVPEVRHYEGCILCTPPPSPRTSEEDIGRVTFGLSKQNPGPPPSSPAPSPNSYQAGDGRRSTLLPAGVRQLNSIFEGLPEGSGPGPSNRSTLLNRSSITNVSQSTEADHGPYNPQSYHDGYSTDFNNFTQSFGRNGSSLDSQGGRHTEPDLRSGSTEFLTEANTAGNCRGRRRASSRSPSGDQVISGRRPRGSIFNRRTPVFDLESGIRTFPFANCPIFPINNGIRLPDYEIPHLDAEIPHRAVNTGITRATTDFEMVDLNEPGPAVVRREGFSQSRLERLKQALTDSAATSSTATLHACWEWLLFQKWAILLLTFTFCFVIAMVV